MDTFKVVLTFESEDQIVWFGHTNETTLALLKHNAISAISDLS